MKANLASKNQKRLECLQQQVDIRALFDECLDEGVVFHEVYIVIFIDIVIFLDVVHIIIIICNYYLQLLLLSILFFPSLSLMPNYPLPPSLIVA